MKSAEKVGNGPINKWLNFGGDPDQRSGYGPDPDLYRDTGKTCLGGGMTVCTVPVLLVYNRFV